MTAIMAQEVVFSARLSAKARLVYLYLAKRSNKENTCFPSKATIARESGLSESGVTRALSELVLRGLVEKAARYRRDNGRSSNLYTLLAEGEAPPQPEIREEREAPPCQDDRGEGVNVTPQELVQTITRTYTCKTDRPAGDRVSDPALRNILDRCDLDFFRAGQTHNQAYSADYSVIFRKAILHLYYAKHLRVGQVCLPREHVRACLQAMDWKVLYDARNKLEYTLERSHHRLRVRNSSAYALAVVYNCIAETQSDGMLGVR